MTLADARAELVAALVAAGVRVGTTDTPSARVVFRGMTIGAGAVRGQSPATFGIVILGGSWDADAAADELAGAIGDTLTAVRELAGWGIGDVTGERIIRVDGNDYIAAEIPASAMIDY